MFMNGATAAAVFTNLTEEYTAVTFPEQAAVPVLQQKLSVMPINRHTLNPNLMLICKEMLITVRQTVLANKICR